MMIMKPVEHGSDYCCLVFCLGSARVSVCVRNNFECVDMHYPTAKRKHFAE